ncbi:phosphate ABC transporter ATP-binding protein [bacterium]|nr:phosphate ABC transporter ATP-binding protein [bacterium]MBU4561046.1 phosphate ABC transporter ATP-binding protein [bacterium]MCG2675983.1 phosphate ABC transporter ATP-binding protein [bacterium]MCG2678162.1 phosphate ABC transporter ATP-binding protein [bacterium]
MREYAIRTHNLSREYDGEVILKEINLQLERGRIHAIIGPSGVGKSVLLRLLNLLERPTSGEIYFDGKALKENNYLKLQRRMTLVFQKPALFNTSVYENVAYGLKVRRENRGSIAEKVEKALGIVGLKGYKHKRARDLSGGEKQRVAIARAMVLEPEILFLDEPTSDLDPRNVAIIEELIKYINREFKTTIVIATHNMFQARRLAHQASVLFEGRIIESGNAQEIFTNPQDKRILRFIEGKIIF